MISISVVLIPIHAVWSILWSIPYVSDWLLYSIPLRPKKDSDDGMKMMMMQPQWSAMMGFNSFAGPDDFNELPSFDYDDSAMYDE